MSEKKPVNRPAPEVCPPWLCFTFDNFLRRMVQNPGRILRPYIKPGWTALDVGPGMGYFTITMAKLVGNSGKVIAADLQPQMLAGVRRRAVKAGLQDRIILHQSTADSLGISEPADFCLTFWMVHEVPNRAHFINEIAAALKPGGLWLISEPEFHVSKANFTQTLELAKTAGLSVIERPKIFMSNAVLLKK
ncbi:MAG: class I SAM-dependent methyltransferase [Dehalococcoidales bacterium]|jgi:ubiquinone/menaquinone biosynthesis C-methylase UbiE